MANQSSVIHDPLGLFVAGAEISSRDGDARELGEDVLQLEVRRRDGRQCIVDVGWYRDRYVVLEVENQAWDSPSSKKELRNLVEAVAHVRRLVE